jgi:hypothetical protein
MQKVFKLLQSIVLIGGVVSFGLIQAGHQPHRLVEQQQGKRQNPQVWFKAMKQKYPVMNFDDIEFAPDNQWAMNSRSFGSHRTYIIFYPEQKVAQHGFTPADEASFLHELGHVRNHRKLKLFTSQSQQKNLAKILIAFTALAHSAQSFESVNPVINQNSSKILGGPVNLDSAVTKWGCIAVLALLYWKYFPKITRNLIRRLDESYADNFACAHADADALQARCSKFDWRAWSVKNKYPSFLGRWIWHWKYDFEHPGDSDRAQKAANALWKRFRMRATRLQLPTV